MEQRCILPVPYDWGMPETAPPSENTVHRALADLLRAEAAIKGLSAPTLTAKTGMKAQTVRRILKGEREVGLLEFIRLCSALDVEYQELVERAFLRAAETERAETEKAARIDGKLRNNF